MIALSLVVNLCVLVPLVWALLSNSPAMAEVYGTDQAARRILICIYASIAAMSAVLLGAVWMAWPSADAYARALLMLLVLYKGLTVMALGFQHPVAAANLMIAVLHGGTLWVTRPSA